MSNTGKFTTLHNIFFNSVEGAYTTMTEAEVGKTTFNVKSVIKEMVLKKLGEKTVRSFNSSNNIATFIGCDKLMEFKNKTLHIVFRYSKPLPKTEMTIYFSESKGIPAEKIAKDNVWFIYFKENDPSMWLGIMTLKEWKNITDFPTSDYYDNDIELEEHDKKVEYNFDVESLNIEEVLAPQNPRSFPKFPNRKRIVATEDLQIQLTNKKAKGTKGEEIVASIERQKLKLIGRNDLSENVNWISKEKDGYGYDIESFEVLPNGNIQKIYIEVKTTSLGINTPFDVSLNELEVSRKFNNTYYIYRVFNLTESGSNIKFYKLNGLIEDNFEMTPVAFKAKIKNHG